ncbi:MAG: Gfo/Idh/MocA family oxidoreductase [Verrucomicrobia bacterium]|nr:Gfo/Idh/MocA family oxidoreductase [Verrucomicrobiota bacterium]MBU1856025.1 Gfo/Idh/MocA family oxidoreductase [Verrucomicrobiota bacterium]
MDVIRTAILGYGRSGSTLHAGPIEKNKAFHLTAVCDVDAHACQMAVARFGCRPYDDYHRMLKEEPLDFVIIVTRSDQHCQMTCDCLSAGINVLVTKPWAVNADEAQRMVRTAESSGKLLLPWLPARWGSDLRRLRQLVVEEQAIGTVFLVRRVQGSFGTRNDWQTERRYGGGYLLNWGPHIVDTPIQLLGSPVKSVYGRLKQTINPGDVEDIFMGILTLTNGALVQAEYTIATESLPTWFLQGTRGTIVVNGTQLKVNATTPAQPSDPTKYIAMKAAPDRILEETLTGNLYGDEHQIYKEIAAALCGEAHYPVTPASALELSRVLDAIRTSSDENRVVMV